ncbi:MAG TPA: cation diffusion facilitator family transporter [Acidobacteriota bacterium]|nr:cation diffusion facilitator family transporter [Acidobacteriota bacterium]
MTRDRNHPPSDPEPGPRERFRAPEHDRALRVMEAHRARELAIKTSIFRLSVAAALGLVLLKLGAAWWTNSLAILASGLDSMLDMGLSGLNWFSAKKAEKPPDSEHPFGHGKVESLMGGIQALILAGAAVLIGFQGIERLRSPEPVVGTIGGVVVMLVSALVALGLSRLIRSRGAESESPIIATEQLHYSMDFTSHAGVILALVLQATTGVVYFDPFVSILIAAFVLWQVRALTIDTAQDLLDRELPEDVQEEIVRVLDEHRGEVLAYHGLRTRRAGSQKIISLHVVLCKAISFETSHHIVDHVEQELELAIPRTDVTIHADPCGDYCPGEARCPWSRLLR